MNIDGGVAKTVVVFFGLIASGKSFVARAWAEKHSFPYNNTDVVRKQLAGTASCEPHPEAVGQGIYSPTFSRLTYDALLSFAEKVLDDPQICCVVLDGSYQTQAERERVRMRFEHRARVVFVMCSCREEIIKTRLAQRALDPEAVSDGNWEIYLHQKEVFEYPEELPVEQFRLLETNKAVDLLLSHLDDLLLDEVPD